MIKSQAATTPTLHSAAYVTCDTLESILEISHKEPESHRGLYVKRGLYLIKQGSAYVTISVVHAQANPNQALVRLVANVASGVTPEPALYRQLLILNGRLRFGAFAYEPEGRVVVFAHTLLGGANLDTNEFLAAARDVARLADAYDDPIVARYGGKRMLDLVEESAWAMLQETLHTQDHPLDFDALGQI